jgi:hypothetical protein
MAKKMEMNEACECGSCGKCSCVLGFGAVVFLFGLAWLGSEMHWWALSISWLPILVMLMGLWFVGKKLCPCGCCH